MSYATYPLKGNNCTKWTTADEMNRELQNLNKNGGGLVAGSVIYIVLGFVLCISKKGSENLKFALPMIVAGAIGLGTSIPLVRMTDATKVDDTQTKNLYIASAATLAAPIATFFVYMLGDFMSKGLMSSKRKYFSPYAYSPRGDQGFM